MISKIFPLAFFVEIFVLVRGKEVDMLLHDNFSAYVFKIKS